MSYLRPGFRWLIVGGAAVLVALPTPAATCSLDPTHGARRRGVSYLVLVPTGTTLSADRGLPPRFAQVRPIPAYDELLHEPGKWWWWKARFKRLLRRVLDHPPYGQLAHLEHVGGPDSARIEQSAKETDGEVAVVHWSLTSDCRDALRTERDPALKPGERIFVTGRLREASGWVDERPTFDVTSEDYSYPERQYWINEVAHDERRLRLTEFVALYRALPDYERLQEDTAAALASLRTWVRGNPALAGKFPAARMIERAQFYAAEATIRRGH
jgi:hypothetical protein